MADRSRRDFLAAAGLLGVGAYLGCSPVSKVESEPPIPPVPLDSEAGPMINAFAVDLYAKLANTKGNIFCSPLSISTALGMTATGAKGKTLEQMQKVFHLPSDSTAVDSRYRGLMSSLASRKGGYELTTANAIWAQSGFPWRTEFKDRVAKYGAGLRDAKFTTQPEVERLSINQWVEEQTKQKIHDLFKPNTIDSNTRMALVNAIYFKGSWENEFTKSATKNQPFIGRDGTKSDAPLMFRKGQYAWFQGDDFQMVVLPYKGQDLSMLVILPDANDGLAKLESKLNTENLKKWSDGARPTNDLQVYLPKFKIETDYTLNETLKEMGMPDAFIEGQADFTGMYSAPDKLFISLVVHKTFVDVNEEGTEAAAATGVAIARMPSPMTKPKIFRADHPFVFAIRHNPSQSILFLGRVEKP